VADAWRTLASVTLEVVVVVAVTVHVRTAASDLLARLSEVAKAAVTDAPKQ
jgi:hypothetical protein